MTYKPMTREALQELKGSMPQEENKEVAVNSREERHWWQTFRCTFTKFEVPMLLVVKCDKWEDGLAYIRNRKLNTLPTRCKTREEAVEHVRKAVVDWYHETSSNDNPPNGSCLYWVPVTRGQ